MRVRGRCWVWVSVVVLLRLFPVGWVLVPWCRVDVAGELDGVGGVSLPRGSGRVCVFASAGLLVVGLLVGWALAKAGYGVGGSKITPKPHS